MKRNTLSLLISGLLVSGVAFAQDDAAEQGAELRTDDRIVVTGTRGAGRTALESVAPIDVLAVEDLESHASTELNDILAYSIPAFNFPSPAINDGSDSIRPAQLRGLSPDQTLVLVNGKRRHTSAMLNLNQVGRGAAAVDLNTIPTGAIGAIEVLRDGASAQYGSDAIAGVINVLLREAREGGAVTVTYGERHTKFEGPRSSRKIRDGEALTVSGWTGLALGEEGFLTLSAEFRDRNAANRAEIDIFQQYPLTPEGNLDPRERTFNRLNWRHGPSESKDITLFANAGMPINADLEAYGYASYQKREARSFGFYRRANDARNIPSIYPDGFLPEIQPDITDFSLAAGVRGESGDWNWDASAVYGSNEVDWTIGNTLNRSLGPTSPTSFDAGSLRMRQFTTNFDASRQVDVAAFAGPLNFAVGLEWRHENYKIGAGEPGSYFGVPGLAAGSQVFPGYQPQNAADESRNSIGAYIDLEADITDRFVGNVAVRFEDYSDFGSTMNAKLAGRFQATDALAFRGAVSTGFRAPSLQQSHYTATSTVFSVENGVQVGREVGTFAVDSAIARALGSQPLDAEEAVNFSAGLVFSSGGWVVTLDGYRIEIDDRVLLSENLATPAVVALLPQGINGARFFINAADSKTEGLDLVANYSWTADAGQFRFTAAGNVNKTKLSNIRATGVLSQLSPPPTVFSRENLLRQEEGAPRSKIILGLDWSREEVSALVRATRFGSVLVGSNNPNNDWTIDDMVVVDVEGSINLSESFRLSVGANNLFDSYPTANPFFNPATQNAPFVYSAFSPAGFAGRFIYVRGRYSW